MKSFVYILYSQKLNKFYCGCTDDVQKRLGQHNAGKGNFTSKGTPWEVIKINEVASKSEAIKTEIQIKKRGIGRYLNGLETAGGGAAR